MKRLISHPLTQHHSNPVRHCHIKHACSIIFSSAPVPWIPAPHAHICRFVVICPRDMLWKQKQPAELSLCCFSRNILQEQPDVSPSSVSFAAGSHRASLKGGWGRPRGLHVLTQPFMTVICSMGSCGLHVPSKVDLVGMTEPIIITLHVQRTAYPVVLKLSSICGADRSNFMGWFHRPRLTLLFHCLMFSWVRWCKTSANRGLCKQLYISYLRASAFITVSF